MGWKQRYHALPTVLREYVRGDWPKPWKMRHVRKFIRDAEAAVALADEAGSPMDLATSTAPRGTVRLAAEVLRWRERQQPHEPVGCVYQLDAALTWGALAVAHGVAKVDGIHVEHLTPYALAVVTRRGGESACYRFMRELTSMGVAESPMRILYTGGWPVECVRPGFLPGTFLTTSVCERIESGEAVSWEEAQAAEGPRVAYAHWRITSGPHKATQPGDSPTTQEKP